MPTDRVVLEGMVFFAHHGALPEEKSLGQRFVVDVEIQADLRKAGKTDNLTDTFDYGAAYKIVREVMAGPPKNLLEGLAGEIAVRILTRLGAEAITVRVKKPGVPIEGGVLAHAAVEVRRTRQDLQRGR